MSNTREPLDSGIGPELGTSVGSSSESLLDATKQPPQYGSVRSTSEDQETLPLALQVSTKSRRIILLCSCINVFLSSLDSTMLATLLGVISSDLESLDNVSWLGTSYLLSCAAFQPLFGKISDVFGRKSVIVFCSVLFGFGCLLCGLSRQFWPLVFGRFITGIGGGGFNSMATIAVSDVVTKRQRGLYQGYVNLFFHSGAASGGVVAGLFQNYLGWRMAFLCQVPVCIVCGSLTYFYFELPEGSPGLGVQGSTAWKKIKNLDYLGSFLVVSSLLAFLLAASLAGKEVVFTSKLFQSLIIYSIIGFLGFYFYELRVAPEPIIPVKLLHNQTVLASSLCCWFISMNMFSSIFYLPFYWTSVKNLAPLESGLRLIPGSVTSAFSSVFAGYVIKRTSKYRTLMLITGFLVVVGSFCLYFSGEHDSMLHDSIVSVPLRFGTTSVITIILVAMISAVHTKEQALVTSIQYAFRSTGSTLGVSLSSTLLQLFLRKNLDEKFLELKDIPDKYLQMLDSIKANALLNPSYSFNEAPEFFKKPIISAYDNACHVVFLFIIVTGLLSFVSLYFIEEHDLEKK